MNEQKKTNIWSYDLSPKYNDKGEEISSPLSALDLDYLQWCLHEHLEGRNDEEVDEVIAKFLAKRFL